MVSEIGYRVWDAHVHNWHEFADPARFKACLDRHGIERVNLLGPLLGGFTPTPMEVEASNDRTAAFREAFPERVAAYCYVNPREERHAIDEWRRCRKLGFSGLKLWVAARCNEPCVHGVVEAVIEEQCPILVHTWSKAGGLNLPGESTASEMAELAARHPQGRFIMAHFGGRFERGLAAIRHLPNVFVDYSGSANEAGAYELALEELGAERILFGTDGPHDFLACAGRVLEATASDEVRRKIFFENMAKLAGNALQSSF